MRGQALLRLPLERAPPRCAGLLPLPVEGLLFGHGSRRLLPPAQPHVSPAAARLLARRLVVRHVWPAHLAALEREVARVELPAPKAAPSKLVEQLLLLLGLRVHLRAFARTRIARRRRRRRAPALGSAAVGARARHLVSVVEERPASILQPARAARARSSGPSGIPGRRCSSLLAPTHPSRVYCRSLRRARVTTRRRFDTERPARTESWLRPAPAQNNRSG